jgi:hypothetical protein
LRRDDSGVIIDKKDKNEKNSSENSMSLENSVNDEIESEKTKTGEI